MSPVAESLLWLTPAPLWQQPETGVDQPSFRQPWLAEFDSDDYVQTFLDRLAATDDAGPTGLSALAPETGAGTTTDPYVLYQPLHGNYYLVVGSLVCRRVGLPDREVTPDGQRVSFVMRRLVGGKEQAWLPATRTWVPAPTPDTLVVGEEQHPMHMAAVSAPSGDDLTAHLLGLDEPGRRSVHFGYVPVSRSGGATQRLTPAQAIEALNATPGKTDGDDARVMEFRLRVSSARKQIAALRGTYGGGLDVRKPSLYLMVDLRAWLERWLPNVLAGLLADQVMTGQPHGEALRLALKATSIKKGAVPNYAIRQALMDVPGLAGLFASDEDAAAASANFDASTTAVGLDGLAGDGTGGGLVLAALKEAELTRPESAHTVPPELAKVIVPSVPPGELATRGDVLVLRLVYEHEPCAPVLSDPTPVVRFARVFDPNAPARPIRIEMPDPKDLRNFRRGVGIEMPPKLREILDRISPKILDEEGLEPAGAQWGLGMICSFSIQIIFLVAFIVMFIFLILLNFVFWWMAFLKICFPIPRKQS